MYVRLRKSRFLYNFTDHNKCCSGPLRKAFRQQKLANHVSDDEAQLSGLNRVTDLKEKNNKTTQWSPALPTHSQMCDRLGLKCFIPI